MKGLNMEFKAELKDCAIVEGKKGQYVKLVLKQGLNEIRTFTRDLSVIDLLPNQEYHISGKINEFDKKYNLEIVGIKKI